MVTPDMIRQSLGRSSSPERMAGPAMTLAVTQAIGGDTSFGDVFVDALERVSLTSSQINRVLDQLDSLIHKECMSEHALGRVRKIAEEKIGEAFDTGNRDAISCYTQLGLYATPHRNLMRNLNALNAEITQGETHHGDQFVDMLRRAQGDRVGPFVGVTDTMSNIIGAGCFQEQALRALKGICIAGVSKGLARGDKDHVDEYSRLGALAGDTLAQMESESLSATSFPSRGN